MSVFGIVRHSPRKVEKADKKLTSEDITRVASLLNCEEACIRAVLEVETGNRGGFLLNSDVSPEGNKEYSEYPVILFEGHIFYKNLKNKGLDPENLMNEDNKNILYKSWTKAYYSNKWGEYLRLNKACEIDENCALMATSWGLGQIMGFNYKVCGYTDIQTFVTDMKESEGKQLLAFCNFIKSNKHLLQAIQTKDWATFARWYNGSQYAQNSYDIKLKAAYNKFNQ